MDGLCKEALKHGVKEAPDDGELEDIVIIGQYQCMCHYGVTEFGLAKAVAKALGMKNHVTEREGIVCDIYSADARSTQMGEKLARAASKHAIANASAKRISPQTAVAMRPSLSETGAPAS